MDFEKIFEKTLLSKQDIVKDEIEELKEKYLQWFARLKTLRKRAKPTKNDNEWKILSMGVLLGLEDALELLGQEDWCLEHTFREYILESE